jgi:hypothetical protein
MHTLEMQKSKCPKPDLAFLEKVAINLMYKGAIFIGAGIGLYIALRVLTGVNSQ